MDGHGKIAPEDGIVVAAGNDETIATHEEMSNITAAECTFF